MIWCSEDVFKNSCNLAGWISYSVDNLQFDHIFQHYYNEKWNKIKVKKEKIKNKKDVYAFVPSVYVIEFRQ